MAGKGSRVHLITEGLSTQKNQEEEQYEDEAWHGYDEALLENHVTKGVV